MNVQLSSEGNKFDDIRFDLNEAHQILNSRCIKRSYQKKNRFLCYLRFFNDAFLQKLGLLDFLTLNGLKKEWFKEFSKFWGGFLDARPISILDFHLLRHGYRVKCQTVKDMDWSSKEKHLENWQSSMYLAVIFNYVYKFAVRPIQFHQSKKFLKNNSRVLEYGCSLAPMYRNYKDYLSYKNIEWHLADIINHSFLYSKYCYALDDVNLYFHDISADNMDSPIDTPDEYFDVIYCNMVFEHLNSPLTIAKFLIRKLKPGGVFIFDYILSDGTELDTLQGVTQRTETLKYLQEALSIIEGSLSNISISIPYTVGAKKSLL